MPRERLAFPALGKDDPDMKVSAYAGNRRHIANLHCHHARHDSSVSSGLPCFHLGEAAAFFAGDLLQFSLIGRDL